MSALDQLLAPERLVDLTQPLGDDTVLWPGSRPFAADAESEHATDGVYFRALSIPEHAGTHLDAPVHFSPGGLTTEQLPLSVLVRPAITLDVRELVGDDASFILSAAHVEEIERRDGIVAAGSALLVCTGWDRLLGTPRYAGADALAFPGIGADAAALLVHRGVVGIGIDTLGVDPGHVRGDPAHRVTLPAGLWHLEGLVGLERVPARGAWLVVGALPLVAGSGTPARVFAILP
jgi:kynurenine formamidase